MKELRLVCKRVDCGLATTVRWWISYNNNNMRIPLTRGLLGMLGIKGLLLSVELRISRLPFVGM